jgi:hypothetical protein
VTPDPLDDDTLKAALLQGHLQPLQAGPAADAEAGWADVLRRAESAVPVSALPQAPAPAANDARVTPVVTRPGQTAQALPKPSARPDGRAHARPAGPRRSSIGPAWAWVASASGLAVAVWMALYGLPQPRTEGVDEFPSRAPASRGGTKAPDVLPHLQVIDAAATAELWVVTLRGLGAQVQAQAQPDGSWMLRVQTPDTAKRPAVQAWLATQDQFLDAHGALDLQLKPAPRAGDRDDPATR